MLTPIVVTAFNRPIKLLRCLTQLKDLDNPIYIWIDGPRLESDSDWQLVNECKLLSENIGLKNCTVISNDFNCGTDSVINGISPK